MGTRRTKKRTLQLSFFFDPSRRTPTQSSTPSAAASTPNHTHSGHVAPMCLLCLKRPTRGECLAYSPTLRAQCPTRALAAAPDAAASPGDTEDDAEQSASTSSHPTVGIERRNQEETNAD